MPSGSQSSTRFRVRLSPSLSLSYKLLDDYDLYIRASYKNIFRSPTFNESYYFHYGSTDLEPESTDQYNLGVTWSSEADDNCSFTVTADGYYNQVKDMIVAVPYNMFIWTCINVGKVRVLGTNLNAHATYRLGANHQLLFSGNYTFGWENPWVSLSLHGSGISSRWANNQHFEGTDMDGYWDTGLTAYHTFRWGTQQLEARFDLKNLFDAQYEIVRFYPMPGRSWQVSLKYQL